MRFRRLKFTLIELVIAVAFIGIIGSLGYGLYYNYKHPCVRFEERICTRRVCTWTMNPGLPDWHPDNHCLNYREEDYVCRVCTERKP